MAGLTDMLRDFRSWKTTSALLLALRDGLRKNQDVIYLTATCSHIGYCGNILRDFCRESGLNCRRISPNSYKVGNTYTCPITLIFMSMNNPRNTAMHLRGCSGIAVMDHALPDMKLDERILLDEAIERVNERGQRLCTSS